MTIRILRLCVANTIISGMATSARAPELGEEPRIPPPTLRQAMQFDGLSQAVLVAGGAGLDGSIEWVRVMETPETEDRLRAHDLLLTTGFRLQEDVDALTRLLSKIAAAGGSGLVVKLGRSLTQLPPEMVREADHLGIPLLTVGEEVAWADLMEPLLERIINAEHWRLKRSLDIHRRFTELLLDGKGVSEICRTLAELLGSPVSVEDASFHLLAHAGGSVDAHRRETIHHHGTPPRVLYDPEIQSVLRKVAEHRHPMKVPAFPHLGMQRPRIIAPIMAARELLGVISILDQPPDNEELAYMAVEQAALVMAFALTKEREVAEAEEHVRGEFVDDLIHGTYGDEPAAQRRSRHLRYPLLGRHVVLVTDVDDFRGFLRNRNLTEESIQAVKRELYRRVSGVVRASHPRALLQARSDSVVALIPLGPEPGDPQARLRALAVQVRETLGDWRPGFTVSVGYSAAVEAPAGVATAHREVRAVMDTLARFRRWAQIVAVPELGLTGLLAGVSPDRLVEFSRRYLGTLVEYDEERGADLVATLKAYLEQGEQQAAARRLRIHTNTLRYRLERIREITGSSLEDPEIRLNLTVALRVHSLLGDGKERRRREGRQASPSAAPARPA